MLMRFFSAGGRIGAIRFLIVALIAVAILFGCRALLATAPTASYPFIGALAGATIAKLFAEGGRRCHDIGRSGAVGLVLGIGILILIAVAGLAAPGATPGTATAIGSALLALLGTALFLLPGQKIENSYGVPPPLRSLTATPGPIHPARTVGFTVLAILGVAAIGLLLATVSDGMREQRERRVDRMSQTTSMGQETAK